MKKKEWRAKTQKELTELFGQFTQKIADLRFGKSTGRAKNVREARELRKNKARALTYLHLHANQ